MKMGSKIPKTNRIGEQFTNREDLGGYTWEFVGDNNE